MFLTKSLCCLLTICLINFTDAYRILAIFHTGCRSHYNVGSALCEGLAKAGHDATVIASFKKNKQIPNYTEIWLDGYDEHARKSNVFLGFFLSLVKIYNFIFIGQKNNADIKDTNFTSHNDQNALYLIPTLLQLGILYTNFSLNHPKFRNFLQTEQKFDVALVEIFLSDAFLGVGPHFNVPIIGVSSFGASKWTADLVGTPEIPSYVPNAYIGYTHHMTFMQRLRNVYYYWAEDILHPILFDPIQQKMYEKIFSGENKPSLAEIKRNISLVLLLLNAHVSFGYLRPFTPNMIDVGGLHINRNPQPLPDDIQGFLDGAKYGAIYFSLGSNVKPAMMAEYKKQAILNAFTEFPNYRILFKWDENITFSSHKSDDIMVKPWLEQESVLAHPNIKLFITHGSLLSTQESIYFGKPVIGIPIFGDQKFKYELCCTRRIWYIGSIRYTYRTKIANGYSQ